MHIDTLAGLVTEAISASPPGDVSEACGPGDGYAPYYQLVYVLAQYMVPCTVVELGVAHGRFLHCAALADKRNTVVGVDVARYPELDAVLTKCGNVMFIKEPSVPVPDELVSVVAAIDILHIDTLHTYNQVKAEFEAYRGLLVDGAVVMFDDLHAAEDDVLRFFDELPYPKIHEDRLHDALGYGVAVYVEDL